MFLSRPQEYVPLPFLKVYPTPLKGHILLPFPKVHYNPVPKGMSHRTSSKDISTLVARIYYPSTPKNMSHSCPQGHIFHFVQTPEWSAKNPAYSPDKTGK